MKIVNIKPTRAFHLGLAVIPALLASTGCALENGEMSAGGDIIAQMGQELIGGHQSAPYHLRSTVGIGDVCTAAKVGPRHFLTAAHCVDVDRPGRFQNVPPNFPENDGVADAFLPGESLHINWGLHADDHEQADFTIVKTTLHDSWFECPSCQNPTVTGAADIAVIEIAEDTPQIREARVDIDPISVGDHVVKVGWGCEETVNIPASERELQRYKTEDAWIVPASEIVHSGSIHDSGAVPTVGGSYLITAGHDQDEDYASLCYGDSGGPLYIPNNTDPRVVGVHSDYTFKNPGGVSWTDWHTKVSTDSTHSVGQWLSTLGVVTVGGSAPSSECTCPSGCDDLQQASVTFTQQGTQDACYFFEDLGNSINSHSMAEVNLNGQNITNQWFANGSYPARKDGGYYLYVKGQVSWSWIQASN